MSGILKRENVMLLLDLIDECEQDFVGEIYDAELPEAVACTGGCDGTCRGTCEGTCRGSMNVLR